jgi:hypothetical protein
LLKEADDQNVRLTSRDVSELKDQLSRDLSMLSVALRIDPASVRDSARDASRRAALVARRVDQYLDDIANDRQRFMVVPQLLSVRLRAQGNWEVVSAGVDRALQRATQLALLSMQQLMCPRWENAMPRSRREKARPRHPQWEKAPDFVEDPTRP